MTREIADKTDNSMRAYIYGRYSSHSQKDTSIEQQFEEIYKYCADNNICIIGEYADRAISGKTDNRPEFQRCIKDCAKGKVQYLIVWKVDRFARNRYDSAMYKARLKSYGVRVIYVKEAIPDGPEGILLESILEGSAEYYSANLAQNIRRGVKANALECKSNGSLPLGYRKGADGKFEIEPANADIVKEVFKRYVDGESAVSIYQSLNERGYRTSRGTAFGKNSVRYILQNERYTGVYIHGDVRIDGGVPPLVSKEMFNAAQKILHTHNKSPRSAQMNNRFLLTGKLFCGHCGSPMVGDSGTGKSGTKYTYYTCAKRKQKRACDKKSVKQAWIEQYIVKLTLEQVLKPDVMERIADAVLEIQEREAQNSELPILKSRLCEVNKLIKNVMTAIEQGIITETAKTRLKELEAQKDEIAEAINLAEVSKTHLTKEQIICWLDMFRGGDSADHEFCEKVIETFVRAVYLYDDRIKIVYNCTRCGPDTVNLDSLDDIANGVFDELCRASTKIKSAHWVLFYFGAGVRYSNSQVAFHKSLAG